VFDFRYHVVSLAAVFFALLFGIVIGVGISGRGVLGEAERLRLTADIDRLGREVESMQAQGAEGRAAQQFVESTYDAVMHDRLAGRAIAILFVGDVQRGVHGQIVEAVTDAGGRPIAVRALGVPIDPAQIDAALDGDEELADLAGEESLGQLGRRMGEELVAGGETPLWDVLSPVLVTEVSGPSIPADAIVVARTAGDAAEEEATSRFLEGLYGGLASTVPAVAVETTGRTPSLIEGFRRTSLSSVDNVNHAAGRVSLAVLLAGGPVGHYGVRDGAVLLPPVDPVPPPTEE
jgi:hypothetical protein